MDSRFQVLPPLKRFRLLQQEEEGRDDEFSGSKANSFCLPTKKRKESRGVPVGETTTYCLPAKKRIRALRPDFDSGKPLLPFDLNVEYAKQLEPEENSVNPICKSPKICTFDAQDEILDRSKKTPFENSPPKCIKTRQEEENKENEIPVAEKTKKPPLPKGPKRCILDVEKEVLRENEKTQTEKSYKNCINVSGEENKENEMLPLEQVSKEEEEEDGILCDICKSTDGDPKDPIVFCDGCDLMVHSTCYGNPLIRQIPEGDWFCNLCLASKSDKTDEDRPFSCCLCPSKVGAMKPTTDDGKWAHLVCALLVPEVFFGDPEGREMIDCSRVPEKRWKGKCYVCKTRKGCVIECSESKCGLEFHVTCGLNEDLCIEYKEGKKGVVVAGFCKPHTELWKKVHSFKLSA
ncbi:Senescence-related protein 1 [Hibiscus syriacus]|uniref:Senescence-related protein 1 n=1 Tax=Hibiscus syriacus TaxID=106335 RepID=A0A6A2ZLR9_HIBSY|nr:Senescence-related protein 1 [Hibiscus syriacus]